MHCSQTTSYTATKIKKRSSLYCSSTSTIEKTEMTKKKKGSTVRLSTEPQSVAARERRHRISDRFKILKSLVPGGSKMDTVSMLDQAILYVKFLKAQIWLHQDLNTANMATSSSHDYYDTYLPEYMTDHQMFPDHSHAYM